MENSLVYGTWALVLVTLLLVWVTWLMLKKQIALLKEQTEDNRENLRLQTYLTFAKRFDSRQMQTDRISLAQQFLNKTPHDQIKENVMDFFEDMGLFLRQDFLDEELAWETFGFRAVRWWSVCRNYVLEERKAANDSTVFTDFENLATRFRKRDKRAKLTEPSDAELIAFLNGEANL